MNNFIILAKTKRELEGKKNNIILEGCKETQFLF